MRIRQLEHPEPLLHCCAAALVRDPQLALSADEEVAAEARGVGLNVGPPSFALRRRRVAALPKPLELVGMRHLVIVTVVPLLSRRSRTRP